MLLVRVPALCLETDGRAQSCPQCESWSEKRAIRVMSTLCGMSGEMVLGVLVVVLERSGMAEQCVWREVSNGELWSEMTAYRSKWHVRS